MAPSRPRPRRCASLRDYTSLSTLIREYDTIAAHAVSIGIARWPRHTGLHRTRIAGLITVPIGKPPADSATALQQRERSILAAARETSTAAVDAREPLTRGVSPRMLETTAIYRAKYAITDPTSLGTPPQPGDRLQARDYQLVRRAREVPPHPGLDRHGHATAGRQLQR